MKRSLPPNAKIAKDAKETVQECVSEFISFITSEASDKVLAEKRKTITGDDVLWAMSTLGFDKYVEPLKVYLTRYRESVKGEKGEKEDGKKSPVGGGNFASPVMAPLSSSSAVGASAVGASASVVSSSIAGPTLAVAPPAAAAAPETAATPSTATSTAATVPMDESGTFAQG